MQIKHYDIDVGMIDEKRESLGWHKGWHGSWRKNEVYGLELSNRELEIDCFLSVLQDLNSSHIKFIELGSAWGEWGITLAGVIKTQLIVTSLSSYDYLSVEGEEYYSKLAQEHIDYNRMSGSVIHCAVNDHNGYCYFDKFNGHQNFFDTWCTQGMTFQGNMSDSKWKTWVLALYHLMRGQLTRSPMYTLDVIVEKWGQYPDLIHMDIEGVEIRVLKSTKIRPRYWLIGTHSKEINKEIHSLLGAEYDCIIDMDPAKERTQGLKQDGLQLWRKK